LKDIVAKAVEVQLCFEQVYREPYDENQRVLAICQRVERVLGKRPKNLESEVRNGVKTVRFAGSN
jgi:hypothetical protein